MSSAFLLASGRPTVSLSSSGKLQSDFRLSVSGNAFLFAATAVAGIVANVLREITEIINGLVDLQPQEGTLKPNTGRSRGQPDKLKVPHIRTITYRHSFFPSVIRFWMPIPALPSPLILPLPSEVVLRGWKYGALRPHTKKHLRFARQGEFEGVGNFTSNNCTVTTGMSVR